MCCSLTGPQALFSCLGLGSSWGLAPSSPLAPAWLTLAGPAGLMFPLPLAAKIPLEPQRVLGTHLTPGLWSSNSCSFHKGTPVQGDVVALLERDRTL